MFTRLDTSDLRDCEHCHRLICRSADTCPGRLRQLLDRLDAETVEEWDGAERCTLRPLTMIA